ncbi:MAG: glycogen synthase GlgA [Novosphingobium sp.]
MTFPVLSVASEMAPLVKTGGLADVTGALPAAVAPHGVAMTTLLPGYPAVLGALKRARQVYQWDSLLGEPARLLSAKVAGLPLLALDAPAYFSREGSPYANPAGADWQDNWRRFAALGRAAADVAGGAVKGKRFAVLHAHDWQAAMALAYQRFAPLGRKQVAGVMTIHNMAFQGYFDARVFPALALPDRAWSIDGVEFHGGVSFLKAGLVTADAITTVSPSYAAEIREAQFGMGLEGVIASLAERVSGLVNGIDTAVWNPATDPDLAVSYSARTLARRKANKRALETEFGLEPEEGPLFIAVSRLTWQKGMDVLADCIDHLVGIGGRLALLGAGEPGIESQLKAAAARYPGRFALRLGYDEHLSHRMQGGGDAILVPSRFEPCGLTQLYGLAYGCVPVVARTGGLADTVIDANLAALMAGVATGLQFVGVNRDALAVAISRTVDLYAQPAVWQNMQRNGMRADFSWGRSGKAYAQLYKRLTAFEAPA